MKGHFHNQPKQTLDIILMTVTNMNKDMSVQEQKALSRKDLSNGVIKPQQQRILLLHHASYCTVPGNKCTVTQHCDNMKKLWCHVSVCEVDDCDFQHCDTSKRVLMHYSKCVGPSCLVCVPVRKRIKEGYDHKRRSLDLNDMVSCKRQKLNPDASGSCNSSSE